MGRPVVAETEYESERYLVIGTALPRPAVLAALTPSEVDVIDCWLEGMSQREIAHARGVATRTVINQIARVYEKLGVGSRSELLALVHRESRAERSSED